MTLKTLKYTLCGFLLGGTTAEQGYAQHILIHNPHIQTVQVTARDDFEAPPVITLEEDDWVELSFDELSHDYHQYCYRITHCNADWTPSDLNEMDYMDGFDENFIEDYEQSDVTTMLYTHYRLALPNDDVQLKLSGNYLVTVYDREDAEHPVLKAGFSILDKKANVMATVSGDTDIDHNKTHQQVSFKVNYKGYTVRNPQQELKAVVMQNGRTDNAVTNLKPTHISANEAQYVRNRRLIFDAGNEFRRFETVSRRHISMRVDHLQFFDPYYHATLMPDEVRNRNYTYDRDQNGRFLIRNEDTIDDHNTEADYFFVHFNLQPEELLADGHLYLQGGFTYNRFDRQTEMKYNPETDCYECTMLLKQGAYNYQYLFVPKGSRTGTTLPTEGDFFETENEYLILIYHRPFGERYDQLIGMQQVKAY